MRENGSSGPHFSAPSSRRRSTSGRPVAFLAAVCAVIAALVLAACSSSTTTSAPGSSSSGKLSGTVTVFAATSLTDAFNQIGAAFEKANPGVTVKFNYQGSSSLATSINQGAPADVFASAAPTNMKTVTDAGNAVGTPKIFASNTGEILVESGNPKKITSVKDLANPAIKVVVCAPEVPCGAVAQEIFKNAGVTVKPVSEETNVGGVVTKITLGEADAGIVYVTDAKENASKATGVPIPASQNATTEYPIVQVKDAPNAKAADAFISYVLGPDRQQEHASFGIMPPGS